MYFKMNFYVTGGNQGINKPVKTIERLNTKDWTWSNAGLLNTARSSHGALIIKVCALVSINCRVFHSRILNTPVLYFQSKLIIIGGLGLISDNTTVTCKYEDNRTKCTQTGIRIDKTSLITEFCDLSNEGLFECVDQDSTLDKNYAPHLAFVDRNFNKCF